MRLNRNVFLILGVLITAQLYGQSSPDLRHSRHPGDVIKYEISVSGPSAKNIDRISVSASLREIKEDLPGSLQSFAITATLVDSKYVAKLTVPEHILTGTYYISVSATTSFGTTINYNAEQTGAGAIDVSNPDKFIAPSIKVREVNDKP